MLYTKFIPILTTALAFTNAALVPSPEVVERSGGAGGGGGGTGGTGKCGAGGGGAAGGGVGKGGSPTCACPAIWTTIGQTLKASFLNTTTGGCTALARQAIRAGFHDCGAWNTTLGEVGGCDGSLILSGEMARPENFGMEGIVALLGDLVISLDNQVSNADMIQFAAAAAIEICPLGPRVQVFVGRTDSATPPPEGLLPSAASNATVLTELFANKGINAAALVALIGAHTVSQQFFVNPAAPFAGQPQDDTPDTWDVDFYANTISPPAGVFVFPSDASLATDPSTSATFNGFVNQQQKWTQKFATAMTALSLLGVPGGSTNLIDCTAALP